MDDLPLSNTVEQISQLLAVELAGNSRTGPAPQVATEGIHTQEKIANETNQDSVKVQTEQLLAPTCFHEHLQDSGQCGPG